jgi:predicted metal-binding membrane protein
MPRPTMAVALAATLGLSAAGWVYTVREMAGMMNMGVTTQLGSFASFTALWIPMTAAMMLPGAAPAVLRDARARGSLRAVPLFVGSYLAVWALVGAAVFVVYRPHGTITAGVVVITAGVYESTPFKQHCRRRCHEERPPRIRYGASCVGSSIGLMLMMVALGIMSVTWLGVIAVIGLTQRLLPARAAIDVPLALAIVGLGVLILVAPSAVPGLTPAM